MVEIFVNVGWYGGKETEAILENRENGFIGYWSEASIDAALDSMKVLNNNQPFNYVIFKDGVILIKGVK